MTQELRLRNIDETRNFFIKEIEQNELMSKKHKKVCTSLNYFEHFLTLASVITGCISISAFPSLIGISMRITSSAIRLKTCAITTGIKKYKPIIKKKEKIDGKIVLLVKSKLSRIEFFISRALIDSFISHDEFFFNK